MAFNIIKGKDPIWETDKYDVILVGTSIFCMLSNGFQSKIKNKYPYIDKINDSTKYGDRRKLGKRLTIDGNPIISLLYISEYPNSKRVVLHYDALEHALATANAEFKGKRVLTTVLGSSKFDGNGEHDKVLEIMRKTLKDVDVDVYDYEQIDRRKEIKVNLRKIRDLSTVDREKYKSLWKRKDEILKKLYLS